MEVSVTQFLIICPLTFAAGFVDAVAGGGLISLPAYFIAGLPVHVAIGTNLVLLLTSVEHMKIEFANGVAKLINLITNVTALTVFLTNGKACIPLGLMAGFFSIIGNCLGAGFFERAGTKAVRPIMLIVLSIFLFAQ